MNTLADTAETATYRDGEVVITMKRGTEIRFAVAENPRLAGGSQRQLNNMEMSPFGIHWPELDEDLSFRGLLKGDYGQRR